MKDVKACLSAREDRVSSFHCCAGLVSLRETPDNAVLTSEEVL